LQRVKTFLFPFDFLGDRLLFPGEAPVATLRWGRSKGIGKPFAFFLKYGCKKPKGKRKVLQRQACFIKTGRHKTKQP
jgi:hypothetical protein